MRLFTIIFGAFLLATGIVIADPPAPPKVAIQNDFSESDNPLFQSILMFTGSEEMRKNALRWMRERNETDVVPALIFALRHIPVNRDDILKTLNHLTKASLDDDWFDWMVWLQQHPEIEVFENYVALQGALFSRIDPNFEVFLYPGVKNEIRLEEIVWGGVRKDGIPALTNPDFVAADSAPYLTDDEPVFGIEINGDVRAYPYRFMDWHEMFNDVIGGVPVSLAYCTLCGSGILFETTVKGREEPFVFGSSGFLYRSNKLMYDQQTHSLWNQFTGRPVVGDLVNSGIELKVLPVVTTTWKKWRDSHPQTKVLALETGFERNYTPGAPYGDYFASADLMFPALHKDKRLAAKDQVFGLRISGSAKAWSLDDFKGGKVLNDRVGVIRIVLVGDSDSRTVRAYRAGNKSFSTVGDDLNQLSDGRDIWRVTETGLVNSKGKTLSRLPGHLAYWFAWSGYLSEAPLAEQS